MQPAGSVRCLGAAELTAGQARPVMVRAMTSTAGVAAAFSAASSRQERLVRASKEASNKPLERVERSVR